MVQLVNTPACHAGEHEFKSRQHRQECSSILLVSRGLVCSVHVRFVRFLGRTKTSGMQGQQHPSSKESLILLSVRNVSQATNVILSYEYDVRTGNKDMKFGVKAHHFINKAVGNRPVARGRVVSATLPALCKIFIGIQKFNN